MVDWGCLHVDSNPFFSDLSSTMHYILQIIIACLLLFFILFCVHFSYCWQKKSWEISSFSKYSFSTIHGQGHQVHLLFEHQKCSNMWLTGVSCCPCVLYWIFFIIIQYFIALNIYARFSLRFWILDLLLERINLAKTRKQSMEEKLAILSCEQRRNQSEPL